MLKKTQIPLFLIIGSVAGLLSELRDLRSAFLGVSIISGYLDLFFDLISPDLTRTIANGIGVYWVTSAVNEIHMEIGCVNLAMYLTGLLLGAIGLAKGRVDVRLVRFYASLIWAFQLISVGLRMPELVEHLFSRPIDSNWSVKMYVFHGILFPFLHIGSCVLWFFFAKNVMRLYPVAFSSSVSEKDLGETVVGAPVSVGSLTRLYHLTLDYCIGVVLLYPAIHSLGNNFRFFRDMAGWVFYFGIFIVYYAVFECVFGTTPAKLLTGTIVVSVKEVKNRLDGQIMIRSLLRSLPIDPLTFLGKSGGWHDRYSGTSVVNDKSIDRGGWGYLMIPVLIGLAALAFRVGLPRIVWAVFGIVPMIVDW